MDKPLVKIDIVSDVVCPWCYIGKRRLEKAIDLLKDKLDFEVEYHPFELNPDTPKEGVNHREYLTKKFGGEERYKQINNHVANIAAIEGLEFNFSDQLVSPNTLDAHRLISFAKRSGRQAEMKEALMNAYFEKGLDLTRDENLTKVAVEQGLDADSVETFLKSGELTSEVKHEEQLNYQRGISAVPFYIINNKYGVSGAQPTQTFVQVLTDVGREISQSAETCDVQGKDC